MAEKLANAKLYMVLLGCKPVGRTIEQHDIFFGIGDELRDLIPDMKLHWPEAKGKIHVDAWQQVQYANGYEIVIMERAGIETHDETGVKLFFINLGGYKPGEFEEYHYKMVVATKDRAAAVRLGKETAFFKHTGYAGALAHIDDKYGIDVDDVYNIEDILPDRFRDKYCIELSVCAPEKENKLHIGYFKLDKI